MNRYTSTNYKEVFSSKNVILELAGVIFFIVAVASRI